MTQDDTYRRDADRRSRLGAYNTRHDTWRHGTDMTLIGMTQASHLRAYNTKHDTGMTQALGMTLTGI